MDQCTIRIAFISRHQIAVNQLSLKKNPPPPKKKKQNKIKQNKTKTLIYVALKTEFITFSKTKQLRMYYFEKKYDKSN